MSRSAPTWELFESFLAVMRHGSLSAAARSLNLSQPTLRRHVEALERDLRVVLFTRTTTGLLPTEAATRTLPLAMEMAASAAAFVRAASDAADEPAGIVRIACSEVMGSEALPAMLRDLQGLRPGLEIELASTNRDDDIVRRDADIAIRMHRPTQVGLIARKVGDAELGLFASEQYLSARPPPVTFDDLLVGHVLIGQDEQTSIAATLQQLNPGGDALRFAYRTDSDMAQLAAIRAGVGIGVCQAGFASTTGLRRVLPAIGASLEVWTVMHEDMRSWQPVRGVYEFLAHRMERYYGRS